MLKVCIETSGLKAVCLKATCCCVLKVRIESEVTTLRLWPLMTLLSRTADELYRLDCDGVLMSDSESSSRVSCLLNALHCQCACTMTWRTFAERCLGDHLPIIGH